jgi:RNA polymerase sigma factor (sigma-70 family)
VNEPARSAGTVRDDESGDQPGDILELTTAIASGNTEAFGRFYDRYFPAVYGLARRVSGRDEAFCLDVVQDAMLRIVKHVRPLPDEDALLRWLGAVVRSTVYDLLRSEIRRRRRETRREKETPERELDATDLEEQLAWIRREMGSLDPEDAWLLAMRHRWGWTLNRIGEALGLGTTTVDRRIRRVTARLRRGATDAEERARVASTTDGGSES